MFLQFFPNLQDSDWCFLRHIFNALIKISKGMITGKVQCMPDLSLLVKEYIKNNTNEERPPFIDFKTPVKKNSLRKTSLTDWRKLYHLKENPSHRFSDKRMNRTERTVSRFNQTARVNQYRSPQKSKAVSRKSSNLDSAIMQNFYETQLFTQKRAQTAKIKRHYEESTEKRPASIAISRRKMYEEEKETKLEAPKCSQFNAFPSWTNNKNQILKQVRTEKYERVKIARKYILKKEDLKIEGLNKIQNIPFAEGFEYHGKRTG